MSDPNFEAREAAIDSMRGQFMELSVRVKAVATVIGMAGALFDLAPQPGETRAEALESAFLVLTSLGVTKEELSEGLSFTFRAIDRVDAAG